MYSTTELTLVDGTRIVVPDTLEVLTPYVLREQEDWFEDEIRFLRRALQPGDCVVDIGANFGVYALSLARTVGPNGRVWAFEPTTSTAELLAAGSARNNYEHVVVVRAALSDRSDIGQLSVAPHCELNALVRGTAASGSVESVPVTTLDECLERHGWRNVDFIKIDAEGEEENILRGGERFFAQLSPLVQYETRATTRQPLIRSFAALGYEAYRLVPGLDLLAPLDRDSEADRYLFNIFGCRPDRAERLAARGYLVRRADLSEHVPTVARDHPAHWRRSLTRSLYGAQFADLWDHATDASASAEVESALSLYGLTRDPSVSPAGRFAALEASFALLSEVCAREPSRLRRSSLARVAREYGARKTAVDALHQLLDLLCAEGKFDPSEPFLAPSPRFDAVDPGPEPFAWILGAVLEEFERLAHFSSFYSGVSARQRLETIEALGFGSPEMERRLALLRKRFGS